jgi:hypothetical protein
MVNNSEQHIPVPFSLVAALVQYLATRPYREVHELIAGLQSANEAANQRVEETVGHMSPTVSA